MNVRFSLSLALGLTVTGIVAGQSSSPSASPAIVYPGIDEASAAVALPGGRFVVADDDEKELRVFQADPAAKSHELVISNIPGLKKKADLEGGARIEKDIYWIGSHSRKNDGEARPERHRLFAIQVEFKGGAPKAVPVGKPYQDLVAKLQRDPRYVKYKLGDAAKRAPEEPNALNIEGLAATPEGELLVGFRNPVPNGQALIVPIQNPRKVMVDGKDPVFGDPVELNLGGRGIRSLEYWPAGKVFVISAGLPGTGGDFKLFRWARGKRAQAEAIEGVNLSGLVPEVIFFDESKPTELIVLSDDGDLKPDPPSFRSRRIKLAVP
jgi:uncharacterized protein DUF3616